MGNFPEATAHLRLQPDGTRTDKKLEELLCLAPEGIAVTQPLLIPL